MRGCHLELRAMLALPGDFWSGALLRRDHEVGQTIAALDQVFQLLGEACCRCAIDDIVIKTDRQTQIVPQSDVPIHDNRLLANTAHRHAE